MIGKFILGLGIAGLLAGAQGVHAQTHGDRPAYGLVCKGFPGAYTRGFLRTRIQTTKRVITVDRQCDSSKPADILWPPIFYEDGPVKSIHAELLVYVNQKAGYPYVNVLTLCEQTSQSAFLAMTCIANPNEDTPSGEVDFSVSIGPDHDQAIVTR